MIIRNNVCLYICDTLPTAVHNTLCYTQMHMHHLGFVVSLPGFQAIYVVLYALKLLDLACSSV